ncbi:MAG: helix-turn-helix domain-containing protein [Chloroflexi bacterium]|nr:helix-turn-helix domain-containing protein [Chloroflexota bacterium]MCI0580895.1 helix-turn-helix domain-containing protein [Chloroflexota bacterium]MCI0649743.1 helix-turn-helix domain-containing protein [Chloroflexota bacterium]MCI0725482.1 helix-turn-helix domain-containing protein [Chloroflexota bacterium]
MKSGSKYHALYSHLRDSGQDEVTLTFPQLERILGQPLPASAGRQRAWWSNRSRGAVQAEAWVGAGYHVKEVDLVAGQVTFRKPGLVYNVQREGDVVLWNGELVKALRHHLGLTQAELAEKLGMRQQTISEWETGVYQPRRSTSKFLTIVAEQAGFTYE